MDDIEALNIRATGADAEVTKVSINAYGHGLRDRYILLRAGGAAGFGVGPIIVATAQRQVGGTCGDSWRAHHRGPAIASNWASSKRS